MKTRPVRLSSDERGASAVEFAIIATVLFTLLAGITQFGITFFHYLEICHAAREGARWAALDHDNGSVGTPDTTRYKVSQAAPGLNPGLTDDDIAIWVGDSPPVQREVDSQNDGGDPVRVDVGYDTPIFTPLMRQLFGVDGPTMRLQSSSVEKIE